MDALALTPSPPPLSPPNPCQGFQSPKEEEEEEEEDRRSACSNFRP